MLAEKTLGIAIVSVNQSTILVQPRTDDVPFLNWIHVVEDPTVLMFSVNNLICHQSEPFTNKFAV